MESGVESHVEGLDLLPPVDCASSVNPDVDFLAKTTGPWSSPMTWQGGVVPSRDSAGLTLDIVICKNITVTFDTVMTAGQYIDTIRLQGTLDFAPQMSTRLWVDTLVSEPGSVLQVGTAVLPIASGNKAEIFIPNEPFPANDTKQQGKGLILNGPVRMFGASKTPFASIASGYTQGSDRIHLNGPAPGWAIGDEIVISPTAFEKAHDIDALTSECTAERFRIYSILGDGAIVLGTPDTVPTSPATLARDHTPYPGQNVHVANLTRNVIVRSVSTSVSPPRRGHIMITRGKAQVHNVELRQLGRTDKTRLLDDEANGIPGTNQRGRYPLHFHRTLESSTPERSFVTGAVVNGSPGWGFVNHSSDVAFTDSVSYDVDGAGFVTEASDERGSFDHNIAICGDGDPDFHRYAPRRFEGSFDEDVLDRAANGDLAFTGDGFWVQSPLVGVTNNIATGLQGHAFILWNHGIFEADRGMVVGPRVTDLPSCPTNDCFRTFDYDMSSISNYGVRALANDNPAAAFQNNATAFQNNIAYASFMGFMVRFNNHPNLQAMKDEESVPIAGCGGDYQPGTMLQSTVAWNNYFGFGLSYTLNLTIDGAQIMTNQNLDVLGLAPGVEPWAINADSNLDDSINCSVPVLSTTLFRDVTIRGYERAINFGTDCDQNPRYHLCGYSCVGSCRIDHPDNNVPSCPVVHPGNGTCPSP
jgi:hypothetical protein